jgi:hypothetical protein
MNPAQYVGSLCSVSLPNVFNPYRDQCTAHDLEGAPRLRRDTLLRLLEAAAASELDAIWIGRDLGYRGGRRTGLALTDDIHVSAHADRWGVKGERATTGDPVAERTAAVIWHVLARIRAPIFLWNVFPLHPHEPHEAFTNRAHSSFERGIGEDLLAELINLLRPRRIIAIGNDAAKAAVRVAASMQIAHTRHPSYGGQATFVRQVSALYGLVTDG